MCEIARGKIIWTRHTVRIWVNEFSPKSRCQTHTAFTVNDYYYYSVGSFVPQQTNIFQRKLCNCLNSFWSLNVWFAFGGAQNVCHPNQWTQNACSGNNERVRWINYDLRVYFRFTFKLQKNAIRPYTFNVTMYNVYNWCNCGYYIIYLRRATLGGNILRKKNARQGYLSISYWSAFFGILYVLDAVN